MLRMSLVATKDFLRIKMETISQTRLGNQVFWRAWIRFNLLANLIHEYVQVFHFVTVIRAPDCLEKLSVWNRDIGMRCQVVKQIELFRCEAYIFSEHGNVVCSQIDFNVIEDYH